MIYTQKQRRLMALWQKNQLKRINILEGSVSSGKTWISLVLWAFWVHEMPDAPDHLYLMSARSLTTLKRNCLLLLQSLVGESNFRFSISAKEGWLFGRHILLEGANDAQAEAKIRGLTLQGAYVDEATKLPEDFFAMLLSRLRKPGAKLIATTNPDFPGHWLKTKYIDRADQLDLLDMSFVLDDNTTLPPDYVENIKKEYTGVFYDRFILGLWVLAEGLIYPMYQKVLVDSLPDETKQPSEGICMSIDYGTMNAFACLLWKKFGGVWYATKGYYYSGRDSVVQKTDGEYLQDLQERFREEIKQCLDKLSASMRYGVPAAKIEVIIDPSAASFIALLKKSGWAKVRPADNDVLNGIRETASAMNTGKIKVWNGIKEWETEAGGYVWDSKSGDEKPLKIADHCLVGDTMVDTKEGSFKIRDLIGKEGYIWSYSRILRRKVLRKFTDVRMTRKSAKIYKVTFTDGRVLRCTGEHRILTANRGWVQAKYLTTSDRILDIMD